MNFEFALGLLMDWDDPVSVEGKGEPHQQHQISLHLQKIHRELEDGIWQFFTGLSWGKVHFFRLLITWLLNPSIIMQILQEGEFQQPLNLF